MGFGGDSHGNLSLGTAGECDVDVKNCAELRMWVVEQFRTPICVLPLSRRAVYDLIGRLHVLVQGRVVPGDRWVVKSITEKGHLVLSPTSPDGGNCAQLCMWMAYAPKEPSYVMSLSRDATYDLICRLLEVLQQHEGETLCRDFSG